MKTNIIFFWGLFAFFIAADIAYIIWAIVETGTIEWVGAVALALSGALGAMIASYLGMAYKAQGGELPEDITTADIDDGDPEVGFYSPWSWWPILVAAAVSLAFLGIAVGTWLTFIGLPLLAVTMVGWTYEYYRGYFAR